MRVRQEAEVVFKEAESGSERVRLGREAAVLRAVAHPGVVRLAGVEGDEAPELPDRLLLHPVRGSRLADGDHQPVGVVAGWGAAVATVLADLHDLGYAHGDIRAEHVLFDPEGRPVLCGFGSARRVPPAEAGAAFHADVAALVRLLLERLPPGEAALRRTLSRWERARPGRHSGARDLASALVRRVPAAHVGPADPVPDDDPGTGLGIPSAPGRRRLVLAVGGAAAAVLAAILCLTLTHPGGSLSTRTALPAYVLRSAPGEQPLVVVGRWGCGPATPAVLDARSGAVWLFPAWPAEGTNASGTLLRRVPSADGLAVATGGPGCDRLVVLRNGAPDLPLVTERNR